MWRKFVKDYLSFSKKERTGIFVMLIIILLTWLFPFFYSRKLAKLEPGELAEFRKEAEKFTKVHNKDSSRIAIDSGQEIELSNSFRTTKVSNKNIPFTLFDFDPNTISAEGWKKLGLRDKTILTIQNYLSKGGEFRTAADLNKVYGLHQEELERLLPYVRIKERVENNRNETKNYPATSQHQARPKKNSFSPGTIDINAADTTSWIALPGIGTKLAARIVLFREKLGGFCSIDQVAETFGLKDSVFQKIKPALTLEQGFRPVAININTADIKTLSSHPYIRYTLANAIVQYRNQHGEFNSIESLGKITVFTPELLEKIRPYITLN